MMDKKTLIHVIDMVWLIEVATCGEYGGEGLDLLEAIRSFLTDKDFNPLADYSATVVAALSILYDELDKLRCIEE